VGSGGTALASMITKDKKASKILGYTSFGLGLADLCLGSFNALQSVQNQKFLRVANEVKAEVEGKVIYSLSVESEGCSDWVTPKRLADYRSLSVSDRLKKIEEYESIRVYHGIIDAISLSGYGDCGEQACYAAKLMKDRGYDVAIQVECDVDHAYVVAKNISGKRYIIDPWRGIPVIKESEMEAKFRGIGSRRTCMMMRRYDLRVIEMTKM
jgi:hypothetical protein